MFNEKNETLFFNSWIRLMCAYILSFAVSFAIGIFITKIIRVSPETVFDISTKRLSFVIPIFESSAKLGINQGVVLFTWNTLGALITISFLYTAQFFNPQNISLFPQGLRKAFCGRKRMKILCYLPGCMKIEEEPIRRLYVWLLVPWLGMILLGIESGLTVSTSSYTLGSYFIGFVSLAPHGIIEIPTFALAGAVALSAHFIVKNQAQKKMTSEVFNAVKRFKNEVPLPNIITLIIICLFIAGLIEGLITQGLVEILLR